MKVPLLKYIVRGEPQNNPFALAQVYAYDIQVHILHVPSSAAACFTQLHLKHAS